MLNLEKGKYKIRVYVLKDTSKATSINRIMDIAERYGDVYTLEYFLQNSDLAYNQAVYACLFKLKEETGTWEFVREIR